MPLDDLVPLFVPPPTSGPAVGFRQGVVRDWNQATAENIIDVGGAIMTNLPVLNTNEASLLGPGAIVGILTAGSSWFILGRVTVPGTPEAASALRLVSNRIVAAVDSSLGKRSANTYGDLTGSAVGPSVALRVGASGKALAIFSAQEGYTGAFESSVGCSTSVSVSGATTIAAGGSWGMGFAFDTSAGPTFSLVNQSANIHLFTDLNPGDHTFTMRYRSRTGQLIEFSERELCVFAM